MSRIRARGEILVGVGVETADFEPHLGKFEMEIQRQTQRPPPYLSCLGDFLRPRSGDVGLCVCVDVDGIQLTTEGMAFHLPAIFDRHRLRWRAGGLHVTIDGMAQSTWASGFRV